MFLKALNLKGFKSFAEPTELELETGITVVVGPNGSGKSNVVDAIAWVLGAQAPSSVRSSKMDDVIFAGSAQRPALGRAEVSLTIDNSAGLLPIEFAEVTLTRTLFRTGDSEYAINGVPCRLLDIQELLSDTGVGRQQHVIVSQGQIDAVLNARPEDRRLILEEAAGVLKFRRRKEKAERRLAATEGNLTRLQDLLREVRRQLRPLERQAEAARRHGDLVAELTALRVHIAGRDLASWQARREAAAAGQAEMGTEQAGLKADLSELDAAVLGAEARLAAGGGDDLGDALVRLEALRERARGLAAVLAERRRGVERERGAFVDQAVVATLEAESARLAQELDQVDRQAAELVPEASRLAAAEEALASERAAVDEQWPEGAASTGRAAEARGELAALRSGAEQGEGELSRGRLRLDALDQKVARLGADAGERRAELRAAEAAEQPLAEALAAAEAERADADSELAAAEVAWRTSESDHHAWTARAEALALALDEARARAGLERLVGVTGVAGTMLELVDVDEGWEAAFEAAAGQALAAVVVDGPDAGRAALDRLAEAGVAGSVVALGLRPGPSAPGAPGSSLRPHVRAAPGRADRAEIEALLDALVGTAVTVDGGWGAAVELALAHPGAVVVTREGDHFGPRGWRLGAAGSGVTGAALEEARARAADAARTALDAEARRSRAVLAQEAAHRRQDELSRSLDDTDGRLVAAADALARVEADRRDATVEAEALRAHLDELADRVGRDRERVRRLEVTLPELEAEEADVAERGRARTAARNRLEERTVAVSALRTDLEIRGAGLDQRRQFLRGRLSEVDGRLDRNLAERHQVEARRLELDHHQRALDRLAALVADRSGAVEAELAEVRERRRRQSDEARRTGAELDDLRRRRSTAERRLEEVRDGARRAEIEAAEVALRIETAVESLRRDLDCSPQAAMRAPCPPLAEGVAAPARARELERDLRLMGPVNPLALQEFEVLEERHRFLQDQLEDVKSTRRDLAKVIRAVDAEIVNVFASAYADVAANFEQLFHTLFPGGQGRLTLSDPGDLLDTGIEVEARPSGKNVRKLSLLSGGERSLTALAFLFAVFRSRPSPFYVMDEVEAALDDVNLHRFLDLIHEFREDAQLLIVSHQKRTMEAADCLYGVTMAPGGSSKVVSERVGTPA